MAAKPKVESAEQSTRIVIKDGKEYELGPNEEIASGYEIAPGLYAGMIGPTAPGEPRPKKVWGVLKIDPETGVKTFGSPTPYLKKKKPAKQPKATG